MWKPSWVAIKLTIRLFLFGACVILVAACASNSAVTIEPTQALVLAEPIITPSPVPATDDQGLAGAADIGGGIGTPTLALSITAPAPESWQNDPVASELVALAQRRVATQNNLTPASVEVKEVTAYIWRDTSLGCPTAGEKYTAAEVDGYRILLKARDKAYIFHTDFDRAVPCDAANERLPEKSG
jgi:hypothetical protein